MAGFNLKRLRKPFFLILFWFWFCWVLMVCFFGVFSQYMCIATSLMQLDKLMLHQTMCSVISVCVVVKVFWMLIVQGFWQLLEESCMLQFSHVCLIITAASWRTPQDDCLCPAFCTLEETLLRWAQLIYTCMFSLP